jgi:very-short-patch-repair endonuclease
MDQEVRKDPPDRAVAELARRQHGVVGRAQLTGLGLSLAEIDGRVRRRRLHRVHQGVYAVGHLALTCNGRFMAAVLACGEGAALSHFSAAVLWRILDVDGAVHVTAEKERKCRGVVVHQAPLQGERLRRQGIVVTTPARTLVDLADVVTRRRTLERAFDEAEYLRLDWQGAVPRHGRRGSALLASVLARHTPGSTRTLSDLEEMFLALCDDYGFPRPEVNCRIERYLCDFVWRDQRLIVETDGGAAHGTRRARERDPIRDAELQLAGWMVMRIPYMRLLKEPDAVAAQVGRALKPAPAAPASPHQP